MRQHEHASPKIVASGTKYRSTVAVTVMQGPYFPPFRSSKFFFPVGPAWLGSALARAVCVRVKALCEAWGGTCEVECRR